MDDLGVRAAAIAAVGPIAGLVARLPHGSTDRLSSLAQRFVALAAPPMASVFVTGRADVALATGAHGVILRNDDLDVLTVRALCHPERSEGSAGNTSVPERSKGSAGNMVILRSVHTVAEAQRAADEAADGVIVGSIWASATHPGREPAGTSLLREIVSVGLPTYAIGGVTAARSAEARDAGAWGVAAISAVWDESDCYRAALEMIKPWM